MWQVHIDRNVLGRVVTVLIANEDPTTGVANILMKDQSWCTIQPGVAVPAGAGIELPMECLRELQSVLGAFLGDSAGNKELKADLLTEKRRVEELHQGLLRMLAPQSSVLYSDAYASTPMQTSGIMKGVSPSNP